MSEPETKPWIPSHPLHDSHNIERLTEHPTGCKRVGSTFGGKADSHHLVGRSNDATRYRSASIGSKYKSYYNKSTGKKVGHRRRLGVGIALRALTGVTEGLAGSQTFQPLVLQVQFALFSPHRSRFIEGCRLKTGCFLVLTTGLHSSQGA
jgi:hypothetical protein